MPEDCHLCEVDFFECVAGGAEVFEFHLRVFAGEEDTVGAATEGGHDRAFGARWSGLAVGSGGGDVDVDAGPEFGGEAFEGVAGAFGLAVDVFGGEAGDGDIFQIALVIVVEYAVMEVE